MIIKIVAIAGVAMTFLGLSGMAIVSAIERHCEYESAFRASSRVALIGILILGALLFAAIVAHIWTGI